MYFITCVNIFITILTRVCVCVCEKSCKPFVRFFLCGLMNFACIINRAHFQKVADEEKEPKEEEDPWAGLSYTVDLETGELFSWTIGRKPIKYNHLVSLQRFDSRETFFDLGDRKPCHT